MHKKDLERKIKLSEIILPILLAKNKEKKLNILKTFEEVEEKTNIIIEDVFESNSTKENIKSRITQDIKIILSNYIVYEIVFNKNNKLDDCVESILDIYHNFKIEKNNIKFNDNIIMINIISKIFTSVNKFHSMLYYSGLIELKELKKLNENIIKNIVISLSSLIEHLKRNKISGNTFIYDMLNIASNIYVDVLDNLYINLSKSETKSKKYVNNLNVYIKEINILFVEHYSLLNMTSEKVNKIINLESKNEKN